MNQQNVDPKLIDYLAGSSNNVVPQVVCAVIAEIRHKRGWFEENYYYAALASMIIKRQHPDWTARQAQHRAGNVVFWLEERERLARITPGRNQGSKNVFHLKFGEPAPCMTATWCEIVFGSEEAAFSAFDGWRTFIEQALRQHRLPHNWVPAATVAPSAENLNELTDEEIDRRIVVLREELKRRKLEALRAALSSHDEQIGTAEATLRDIKIARAGIADQIEQLEKS